MLQYKIDFESSDPFTFDFKYATIQGRKLELVYQNTAPNPASPPIKVHPYSMGTLSLKSLRGLKNGRSGDDIYYERTMKDDLESIVLVALEETTDDLDY